MYMIMMSKETFASIEKKNLYRGIKVFRSGADLCCSNSEK